MLSVLVNFVFMNNAFQTADIQLKRMEMQLCYVLN